MQIGVIGTGRVGSTLGRAWAASGHELTFGSRNPTGAKVTALVEEIPGTQAASFADTLDAAEVVLLAVPSTVVESVVAALHGWNGKIVLDATNDLTDLASSSSEAVQRVAPGAHVVKAFNVIGVEAMARAQEVPGATLPLAGNDDEAVAVAAQLARDAGFDPLHVGGLAQAASLERLASVWIDWSRTLGRGFLWQVLL